MHAVRYCPPVLIVALLLAAGCRAAPADGLPQPTAEVRKLLSDRGVEILRNPTRVEVYRIESGAELRRAATRPSTRPTTDPADVGRYPVIGRGPDRDAAFGRRLAAVFLDARTFDFDSAKGCMFTPGVAFRVYAGDAYLDLLLCFSCNEFQVLVPAPAAGGTPHRGMEDTDRARPVLVRLAKEALPGDAVISGLKEVKD
ncbi:MAG TPA: hypothetical protein VF796_25190 [Humisphaera sp.]